MSVNAMPNEPPDPGDVSFAGGGQPPYDGGMDRRLTVLETRFDTILPTLATKDDPERLRSTIFIEFEKLRGEFHNENEKLRGEFRHENEKLRAEFRHEMDKLRGEFSHEMDKLRGEFSHEMDKLRIDVSKATSDILKWMVGVVLTLLIGFVGLSFTMINVARHLSANTPPIVTTDKRPSPPPARPETPLTQP